MLELLHSWGLKTKVERGGRVFPESDSALEVRNIFMKILKKYKVQVHLNEPVTSITVEDGRVVGVTTDKEQYACDAAIICTGGASYPLTGSTGDGYALAKKNWSYHYRYKTIIGTNCNRGILGKRYYGA